MKRLCTLAAVLGIVLSGVLLAGVASILAGGISARREPSALEDWIAREVRSWLIPAESRRAINPVPRGPESIAAGLAHFADHCATCHANDGSGDTALGRSMYPPAPDMRLPATQRLTDGELFYIIENGVRFTGMPAWGAADTGEGSWQLVHFIRHLPALTNEEKARMEALNPRSPDEWRAIADEEAFLRGEDPEPRRSSGHGGHAH